MSKTSDAIMVEFGFDLSLLMRAMKHHKLNENEELKSFQKIVVAQRDTEARKAIEAATPPKEQMAKLIAEANVLGKPEYKSDGTMTFDYFLETSKLVVKFTYTQTKDGLEEHAKKRREAVKAKDIELCQKMILEMANWEQLTTQIVSQHLYQHLKVPKQVFEKSMQTYMMEPEKRAIYEEEIQKVRD